MPAERFFLPRPYSTKEEVFLKDQELHHLVHVMRIESGEKVELVNGLGQLAEAIVTKIEKQQARLVLEKVFSAQVPPPALILAQAIPRLPRLEYLLEKAIELGVTELWLFPGEQSERKELSPSQRERLNQIAISSLKQCGRLFLPKITLKPPLYAWTAPQGQSFFGDTREDAPPLLAHLLSSPLSLPAIFFVGPEKGFHPSEVTILEDQLKAQGVKLHENILRVDTAAIASLSILSSFCLFPLKPLNSFSSATHS